jgi:hypothetical protein
MRSSIQPVDWQPQATVDKRTQGEMAFMAQIKAFHTMAQESVARASFSGCLNEAAKHSGMDDHEIADAIHICHGYMSRFMRGVAQQWAKRLVAFMRKTQSYAPLQWIADQMGCDILVRSVVSAELAAARSRVAELERSGRVAA